MGLLFCGGEADGAEPGEHVGVDEGTHGWL